MGYIVTVKVVRTVQLNVVEASNKAEAKRIIQDYGLIEAVGDYHCIGEDIDSKIVSVVSY